MGGLIGGDTQKVQKIEQPRQIKVRTQRDPDLQLAAGRRRSRERQKRGAIGFRETVLAENTIGKVQKLGA